VLVVRGQDADGHWHLALEGVKDGEIIGFPLDSTLAALLGYDVAHESWPVWIDRLAAEIAAG